MKKETPTKVFSYEFYEIFNNTFFTEHLRAMPLLVRWVVATSYKTLVGATSSLELFSYGEMMRWGRGCGWWLVLNITPYVQKQPPEVFYKKVCKIHKKRLVSESPF